MIVHVIPDQCESKALQPGDQLDLGSEGLIVYYTGEEAEAIRIFNRIRQKQIRDVIEFTENRCHPSSR